MTHEPVMVAEVVDALVLDPDGWYADGTLGEAGHTRAILERLSSRGGVFALDRDPVALDLARAALGESAARVRMACGNFRDLPQLLPPELAGRLSGILLDLGLRSSALDDPQRGFAFRSDGPLDMRFDQGRGETAAQLLARLGRKQLVRIFTEGTSRANPHRLADGILRWRRTPGLRTTGDLVSCLRAAQGRRVTSKLLASVFAALRMEVNQELEDLDVALAGLPGLLQTGGVLCVLAYQSQEDRRVKALRKAVHLEMITRKPLRPSAVEGRRNRRAQSARLRVFRRLPAGKAI